MHNYNEIVEELCKERTSSTTVISKQWNWNESGQALSNVSQTHIML
jgi:hypothetical protein